MSKKFLVGVGQVFAYDSNENLLFTSKTLSTSGIEVSTSNTEIRGGQGNALQYVYYHTGAMSLNLTDTQYNLGMIAANVGSSIVTNNDIWDSEEVTLGAGGTGSVTNGTPKVTPDGNTTIYGWVEHGNGTSEKVAFTGSGFTSLLGSENDKVCVRYFRNDSASRSVTVEANFIPSIARIVIDTQLASSNTDISGASIIGKVQVEVPKAQFSGAQSIEMTSDGVSNTPLTANALAYTSSTGGCSSSGYYAKITEIINSASWYDNVIALAILDNDIDLEVGDPDVTLQVYAVPSSGSSFLVPDYGDLDFASSETDYATVGVHTGVVHAVAAGVSIITATIHDKNTVQATATATITAP